MISTATGAGSGSLMAPFHPRWAGAHHPQRPACSSDDPQRWRGFGGEGRARGGLYEAIAVLRPKLILDVGSSGDQ